MDKVECSEQESITYSAKHGDFFFVRSSLKLEGIGKSATLLNPEEPMVFECHLVRGRPNLDFVNPKFLNYFLNSHLVRQSLVSKANQVTMTTIDQNKFKDSFVSLPPLSEQQSIARFLDSKTAQIDALIAKKETLLAKLAEKRTALISQAVTKGLDPTVPLKPSGIEWLGDIPAHWIVTRAKFVANIFVPQRNKPDLNEEEGLPWLTMDDMTNDRISTTSFRVSQEASIKAGSRVLRKGAVIASCVGNFGVAAINDVDVQKC